jgi:ATPase family AAA domain-containing protein 3A/B
MVVLATNRPGDLDDAVLDRMDEAIHFDLPGQQQRQQLLTLYLDKYIRKAGTTEVRRLLVAVKYKLNGGHNMCQRHRRVGGT